jgi:hypothetical protein
MEADEIWTKALLRLKQWLRETTHPELASAIIRYLSTWRQDTQWKHHSAQAWLKSVLLDQTLLGWSNFVDGFISTSWQSTQKIYFLRIGSRRSPKRWTIALIRKLWEVAWDMWEHQNGALHDKEQSIIIQGIHTQIKDKFSKGDSALPKEARALFRPGLASILAKPFEVKQQWLARIQLAREKWIAKVSLGASFQSERRGMASWLQQK